MCSADIDRVLIDACNPMLTSLMTISRLEDPSVQRQPLNRPNLGYQIRHKEMIGDQAAVLKVILPQTTDKQIKRSVDVRFGRCMLTPGVRCDALGCARMTGPLHAGSSGVRDRDRGRWHHLL